MKLVGYNSFYSQKKDAHYYVLQLTYPFREGEGHGVATYQKFVDPDVFKMVDNNMIGHEVGFDTIEEGRFTRVVGIHVADAGKGK